ncbi:MAG: cyclically-permuted mutarotase family protein [Prevotella sp.]|nr:cyclically-permuted mutarotase family protein [Prevotella sp.]
MTRLLSLFLFLSAALSLSAQHVRSVAGFPAAEPGYSLGVSACYAGQIGDYLVVAGGCNFPEAGKPKKYYAGVYAARMDRATLQWRLVGFLPEAAAYGATVTCGDSLLFLGGNNTDHALAAVYSVRLNSVGTDVLINRLADLPATADNMAVALVGNDIFVVGGNQNGKPSADVLRYKLGANSVNQCSNRIAQCSNSVNQCSNRIAQCSNSVNQGANSTSSADLRIPGAPRVQPVAAAYNDKLYVWGGFYADGEQSKVHTDGYVYDVNAKEWSALSAPCSANGEEMTLSGGIAWADGDHLYATGGVNRTIFLDAISGRYECVKKDDYLKQPIDWYKFSGNLYVFDAVAGQWLTTTFVNQALARAGAQAVPTPLGVYYIGGELKPALRTPQIVIIEN